ncbi:MAG: DNA polymerase III subunit delta [Planctomycetes bacterium]|nr:DNA polymerase III subunit delta [Planctomycetota bacterium]
MGTKGDKPPIVAVFGDEEFRKAAALQQALDALLPPEVDRALALCTYDGSQNEDQGGPAWASVMDDLATLPFLSERRVVVIREADKFISACRERLERYLAAPAPTGTLILECRSLPRNTRLYKAIQAAGGRVCECKKLVGRALIDFVVGEAHARKKNIDHAVAARIVELTGSEQGMLSAEIEKLALYAADRPAITDQDVADLVGQSREEKIFPVMDAAAAGRLSHALRLWHQVLATDPAAIYKALGGIAFVLRKWLTAHQLVDQGLSTRAIAPKVMMYGRERELDALLRRLSRQRLGRLLASIAELDSQAKVGTRSIETGIEKVLTEVAAPAA